jgi:hypothetical protein
MEENVWSYNKLYALLNFIMVNKSRRMRWAGHAAQVGDMNACSISVVGPGEHRHLEDLGIDGRIILR